MKFQVENQSLRFRVDEAEFARLLSGQILESTTALPATQLRLQLSPGVDGEPMLSTKNGSITLQLPLPHLLDYQQRLPCRDGLEFAQPVDGGLLLQITFEVDVRDSVRKRGPRRREPSA